MTTNTPVNSSANTNSLLQQAAQSIINGSTGNASMDVGLLVTTLVNAKTAGRAAALAASQQTGTTQISAFGALSSALGALEAGLATLANGGLQSTFTAVASGKGLTQRRVQARLPAPTRSASRRSRPRRRWLRRASTGRSRSAPAH
jgi:flagellar hook-associated protein 2